VYREVQGLRFLVPLKSSAARAAHREQARSYILLQRATVCQAMVVRFLAPTEKSCRTNKADNHGLSDIGTLQQM